MAKGKISKAVDEDVRGKMGKNKKELDDKLGLNPVAASDVVLFDTFSSGILTLDEALSGGFITGRTTMLFGEELSGKSLISQLAIADMQRKGKKCLLIDAESSYNPIWGESLGINNKELHILRSNLLEKVFEKIEEYVNAKTYDLIVLDSIAIMLPLSDAENEMEDQSMGTLARGLSKPLRRIITPMAENNISLLLINQVREKIGAYMPVKDMPGGHALKHAVSTIVQVNKSGRSKLMTDSDGVVTGVEIELEIIKHRGGANHKHATFRIDYEKGLDREFDIAELLISKGAITQAGAFYNIPAMDKKFQGYDNMLKAMREDPAFRAQMFESAVKIINGDPMNYGDTGKSE